MTTPISKNEVEEICPYCEDGVVKTYPTADKYPEPDFEPCGSDLHDPEVIQALTLLLERRETEAYIKGYNANSRDCYCDSPGATEGVIPHRHLSDDGKSYNIRPDVDQLKASLNQGGEDK
jgi:hypothetical protein